MINFVETSKIVVALALLVFASGWNPASAENVGSSRVAVVELFTSQGCSSCPPADRVLGEIAGDRNVLALSLNVDYWDYLGWKDTLGSSEHSRRQREYAAFRGDGRVYTPQMVVAGRNHVVGSDRRRVKAEIERVLSRPDSAFVPVKVSAGNEEVTIEVGSAGSRVAAKDAIIWLMLVSRRVEQDIRRGENRGRKIVYHNVVRKMMPVGMWHGQPMKVNLPKSELMVEGVEDCVAILQVDGTGPIIGANRLSGLARTVSN